MTFGAKDDQCGIATPSGTRLPFHAAHRSNGVYVLELRPQFGLGHLPLEAASSASLRTSRDLALVAVPKLITVGRGVPKSAKGRSQLLHECFAHRKEGLTHLHKVCRNAPKVNVSELCGCEVCVAANMTRKPSTRTAEPWRHEWGHFATDKMGPFAAPSHFGGYVYVYVAVELSTGLTFVYPMTSKSDEPDVQRRLETDVAALPGTKRIVSKRADGCGEAWSRTITSMCSISHMQMTGGRPYEHNSMSVVERTNLTLATMARASLLQCGLGNEFGIDALCYASKQHNLLPNSLTGDDASPYTIANDGELPDAGDFAPFGCELLVHRNESERAQGDKFSPRAEAGIFIGICDKTHAPKAMLSRRTLPKATRNAVLNVTRFPTLANLGKLPTSASTGDEYTNASGGSDDRATPDGDTDRTAQDVHGGNPEDDRPSKRLRSRTGGVVVGQPTPPAATPAPETNATRTTVPLPRCIVKQEAWPTYNCTENGGRGWTAEVTGTSDGGKTVRVRFVNERDGDGRTLPSQWLDRSVIDFEAHLVVALGPLAWDSPDTEEYDSGGRYFEPDEGGALIGGGNCLDAPSASDDYASAFSVAEVTEAQRLMEDEMNRTGDLTAIVYGETEVPRGVGTMLKWPEEKRRPWEEAIRKEISSLTTATDKKPAALTPVPFDSLPPGTRPRRLLIKLTAKKADSLEGDRAKARAVVDGASEVLGADYRTTTS